MKKIRKYWANDCPYGDYLIEVDVYLEELIGRFSNQDELAYIADLQEYFFTPKEAALEIARNSFYCSSSNLER